MSQERVIAAAKLYASQGWYCLPAAMSGKKKPLVKWDRATLDPDGIDKLFDRLSNLQILTGSRSGILVIDVDPRNGGEESLQRLLNSCGIQDGHFNTPSVSTGGGGTHFYFNMPDEPVKSKELPGMPGIDIKADGGMVYAPPSSHPETGREYAWIKGRRPPFAGGIPFMDVPEFILECIRDRRSLPAAPGEAMAVGDIVGGVRNITLTRLAGLLRQKGYEHDRILAHLNTENAFCKPPLPQAEVDSIATSICRYQAGTVPAGIKPDDLKKDPTVLETISDSELRIMQLPEPRVIVPGILQEGITILAARPKIGKSWLSLQLGQAIAHGGYALGLVKVDPGQVLYLALEDGPNRIQKRLKTIDSSNGSDSLSTPNMDFVFEVLPSVRANPQFLAKEVLAPHIERLPDLRLIVVDTFARIKPRKGGKHNVYDEDYSIIEPFQDVAKKLHVSIVFVHHLRKATGDDPLDELNASMGMPGAADCVLILKRVRGVTDATLQVVGRDIEDMSYAMSFGADCIWKLVGSAEDAAASDTKRKIREFIEDNPGCAPIAITKTLNLTYDNVRQTLRRMLEEGSVYSLAGKYHPCAVHNPADLLARHRQDCSASSLGVPCPECEKLWKEVASNVRRH